MRQTRRRLHRGLGVAVTLITTMGGCTTGDPARTSAAATGCSYEQRAQVLRDQQREVFALAPAELPSLDAATAASGPLAGWRLSHGHVVLASAGGVGVDKVGVAPPMPPLLLYAPSPDSSPRDWLDHDREDGPYRLVGWAWLAPYADGSPPPRKPCIAPGEWFVHEAGWHLMDGSMLLTPGAHAEPARPPDVAVHFWHPRAWDLHLWAGADGLPIVAFANPNASGDGVELPREAFLEVTNGGLQPLS